MKLVHVVMVFVVILIILGYVYTPAETSYYSEEDRDICFCPDAIHEMGLTSSAKNNNYDDRCTYIDDKNMLNLLIVKRIDPKEIDSWYDYFENGGIPPDCNGENCNLLEKSKPECREIDFSDFSVCEDAVVLNKNMVASINYKIVGNCNKCERKVKAVAAELEYLFK